MNIIPDKKIVSRPNCREHNRGTTLPEREFDRNFLITLFCSHLTYKTDITPECAQKKKLNQFK